MKILLDFRKYDGVMGGVEEVVFYISKYVVKKGHEIVILCKKNRFNEVKKLFQYTTKITVIPINTLDSRISIKNLILDSKDIQEIAKKENVDVIHFPYNWSFPFFKKVPCLLTIHDVIPLTFREAMRFFTNHLVYKSAMRLAIKLNNAVTTISNFSKRDIVEKIKVNEEKIRVISNGLRRPTKKNTILELKLIDKYQLNEGFIINVGGIHERKNIPNLIESFTKLVKNHSYLGKLLIVGNTAGSPYLTNMKKNCDKLIKKNNMESKITFTGFIPTAHLDSLLRRADFLIYPSLYEGFGLPILEAMNIGTPVITSNITGTKEVAKNAAILVNPYDINEMTAQMNRLLKDKILHNNLIKKGKQRANLYSWKKTSLEYLKLYHELSKNSTSKE